MQLKKIVLGLAVASFMFGCGGNTGQVASRSSVYVGTQQPGDVWAWTIGATTFTGRNETLNFDYSGTVQSLPSGFSLLTTSSSNDPDVAVGSKAYSIEIPGTCMLVKPADAAAPIVATGLGENPTADTMSMNWITIPSATFDFANDDAFGVANFAKAEGNYDVQIDYQKLTYSGGPLTAGDGARLVQQEGRYVIEGNTAIFGLQRSGVFMADFGPNMGGMIGMQVPSAPLTWSAISSKHYIGMMVDNGRTQLIKGAPGTAPNTILGQGLETDEEIASGIVANEQGVTLELVSVISSGLFEVNLVYPSQAPEKMFLVAGNVDGKTIFFGFSGSAMYGTYNVMMVEK